MKELAKELAPLVASAMRSTEVGQTGMERAFRPPKKGPSGKAEQVGETQKERLAFLVRKCVTYISNIINILFISISPENYLNFTSTLMKIQTSSFTSHRLRNSSGHLPMIRVKVLRLRMRTST